VQSVILSKENFRNRASATRWAREHEYRTDKIDETEESFRFRQFEPTQCREGSFRSIRIGDGVTGIVCRPKDVERTDRQNPRPRADEADGKLLDVKREWILDAHSELYALDCAPLELELRATGGAKMLAEDERKELLRQLRRGEPIAVSVGLVSFEQGEGKPMPLPAKMHSLANSRFFTFREQDMPSLAASFVGRPFLRDHDRSLLSIGGTVTASEFRTKGKKHQLVQTAELVKPWAVEAALDGTLRQFSISWDPPGTTLARARDSIRCTACGQRLYSLECPHMPGQEVKLADSGESVIVEAEFRNPVGTELSGVAFPAVRGTHVETIRPSGQSEAGES
jgi:hypothetical protein